QSSHSFSRSPSHRLLPCSHSRPHLAQSCQCHPSLSSPSRRALTTQPPPRPHPAPPRPRHPSRPPPSLRALTTQLHRRLHQLFTRRLPPLLRQHLPLYQLPTHPPQQLRQCRPVPTAHRSLLLAPPGTAAPLSTQAVTPLSRTPAATLTASTSLSSAARGSPPPRTSPTHPSMARSE